MGECDFLFGNAEIVSGFIVISKTSFSLLSPIKLYVESFCNPDDNMRSFLLPLKISHIIFLPKLSLVRLMQESIFCASIVISTSINCVRQLEQLPQ